MWHISVYYKRNDGGRDYWALHLTHSSGDIETISKALKYDYNLDVFQLNELYFSGELYTNNYQFFYSGKDD